MAWRRIARQLSKPIQSYNQRNFVEYVSTEILSNFTSFDSMTLCEFPAQMASNAEMFPFDDVIMYYWPFVRKIHRWPVASFTKKVNPRLAKRPLVFNGRLANRGLTSFLSKKGHWWIPLAEGQRCRVFSWHNFFMLTKTASLGTP